MADILFPAWVVPVCIIAGLAAGYVWGILVSTPGPDEITDAQDYHVHEGEAVRSYPVLPDEVIRNLRATPALRAQAMAELEETKRIARDLSHGRD